MTTPTEASAEPFGGQLQFPVLRHDFLAGPFVRCVCCKIPLRSGMGYVLDLGEGTTGAAGPECVRKVGTARRLVPNVTRGVHRFSDPAKTIAHDLSDPANWTGEISTQQQRQRAVIAAYAALRAELLPALGVGDWVKSHPTTELHQTLQREGKMPERLTAHIKLVMTRTNTERRLRYQPLMSLYAALRLGQQALAENARRETVAKAVAEGMKKKDLKKLGPALPPLQPKYALALTDMLGELRTEGTLTERQLHYAEDIMRRMLPKMPKLRTAYIMRGVNVAFNKQHGIPPRKPVPVKGPPLPRFTRPKTAQPA